MVFQWLKVEGNHIKIINNRHLSTLYSPESFQKPKINVIGDLNQDVKDIEDKSDKLKMKSFSISPSRNNSKSTDSE